jgi:hypothetical protein
MEIACPGMFGSVVPIVTFDELPTVLTNAALHREVVSSLLLT